MATLTYTSQKTDPPSLRTLIVNFFGTFEDEHLSRDVMVWRTIGNRMFAVDVVGNVYQVKGHERDHVGTQAKIA